MKQSSLSRAEIVACGEHIFNTQIRPQIPSEHRGMYLVLDIDSGEYEVDREDLQATKRLLARCPEAVVYGLRIGHPSAYRLGGFRKAGVG